MWNRLRGRLRSWWLDWWIDDLNTRNLHALALTFTLTLFLLLALGLTLATGASAAATFRVRRRRRGTTRGTAARAGIPLDTVSLRRIPEAVLASLMVVW